MTYRKLLIMAGMFVVFGIPHHTHAAFYCYSKTLAVAQGVMTPGPKAQDSKGTGCPSDMQGVMCIREAGEPECAPENTSTNYITPSSNPNTQAGCWTDDSAAAPSEYVGPVPLSGCASGQHIVNAKGGQGVIVSNSLTYTPLEPFPGQTSGGSNFCQIIDLIFKFFIYLGAMLAVLFLVLAGVTYMVSEVVDKRSAARDRIKAAVWGLIILLASWIILNTLNPQLVGACSVISATTAGVSPPPAQIDLSAQIQKNQTACEAKGGTLITIISRTKYGGNACASEYVKQDKGKDPGTYNCDMIGPNQGCITDK